MQHERQAEDPSYEPMTDDPTLDDDASEDEPQSRGGSYAGHTLAADGAALGAMLLGGAGQAVPLITMGLGLYVLGAPTVHMVHDRAGVGLGSLGLRVGAPLLGAAIGVAAADCPSARDDNGFNYCGLDEAAVGVLLGMAAAVTIDAAVLAHEPAKKRAPGRIASVRPRLAPSVALTPEKRALVLSGTF
jgi:hypothetical protein